MVFQKKSGKHILRKVDTEGYFELVQVIAAVRADKVSFWNITTAWLISGLPEKRQYLQLIFDDTRALDSVGLHYKAVDPTSVKKLTGKTHMESWEEISLFDAMSEIQKQPTPYPWFGKVLEQKSLSPGHFTTHIKAEVKSILLFKMTFHPGWKALVDDKKVETIMVSPGFVGIPVEPGDHRVSIKYKAPAIKNILLVFTILIFGVLIWLEKKKKI